MREVGWVGEVRWVGEVGWLGSKKSWGWSVLRWREVGWVRIVGAAVRWQLSWVGPTEGKEEVGAGLPLAVWAFCSLELELAKVSLKLGNVGKTGEAQS